MAVLIKGMDMPERCWGSDDRHCPMCEEGLICIYQKNLERGVLVPITGRSPYCPLAEVPDEIINLIESEKNRGTKEKFGDQEGRNCARGD